VIYSALFDTIVKMYGRASATLLRSRAFWPVQVFIDTTSRCNLRCSFCVVGGRFDSELDTARREQELTADQWRAVIDQVPRLSLVTFTGGEPFIRNDLLDVVEYAGRRHRCHIITNATLIDEQTAVRLVDLRPRHRFGPGLGFIGVSIQGSRETHDRVTGRAGSFDKAVEAVRMVQQIKAELGSQLPRFHITTVISEVTVNDLPDVVSLAADLGVEACNFPLEDRGLDQHLGREADLADFARPPVPVATIPEPLLRDIYVRTSRSARDRKIELRWPRMPLDDIVAHYQNRFDLRGFNCYAPWTKLYISYYGAVHPCNFFDVGNVRDKPLGSIWNGDEFRSFRRRLSAQHLFAICPGCCELVKRR